MAVAASKPLLTFVYEDLVSRAETIRHQTAKLEHILDKRCKNDQNLSTQINYN